MLCFQDKGNTYHLPSPPINPNLSKVKYKLPPSFTSNQPQSVQSQIYALKIYKSRGKCNWMQKNKPLWIEALDHVYCGDFPQVFSMDLQEDGTNLPHAPRLLPRPIPPGGSCSHPGSVGCMDESDPPAFSTWRRRRPHNHFISY